MPIPDLTEKGLLPVGIHECSLEEIGNIFPKIKDGTIRGKLWDSFLEYLDIVKKSGILISVYIDGSFTTSRVKPGDIDIILQLPPPNPHILPLLRRKEFISEHVKDTYNLHMFLWCESAPPEDDWVGYFQEIKPKDLVQLRLTPSHKKGILKITL